MHTRPHRHEYRATLALGILAVALIASRHAHSASQTAIRWHGQSPDTPATLAPTGKLLNHNHQYWDDVVFAHAALAFDGEAMPADGRLGRLWKGGAKGGQLTATFPQAYTVTEFALFLRGEGGLTVAMAKGDAEEEEWETVLERATAVHHAQ